MNNVSVKIKKRSSVYPAKHMPLYIQIIYRREVSRIPLSWRLSSDEWNEVSEMVRIPPETLPKREAELLALKENLQTIREDMRSVIEELEDADMLSLERLTSFCRERLRSWTITTYMEKLIDGFISKGKMCTARHYRSTLNAFMRFREMNDLKLEMLNESILKAFEVYLSGQKLSGNTISFYFRILRAVWNHAVKNRIVKPSPFLFSDLPLRVEKTRKRAVQEKVIFDLAALSLKKEEGLALARDFFLFCYYARGMTFVDLAFLTSDNIKGDKVVYTRHKTGQELTVQLLPMMKVLIKRYHNPESHYLFPILKSKVPAANEYESAIRLQNKRLNELGKRVGANLSTYVARHTWASVAKQKGISYELISEGMGHTSVKTTRIYIALLDNTRLDKANEIVILGKKNRNEAIYEGVP